MNFDLAHDYELLQEFEIQITYALRFFHQYVI